MTSFALRLCREILVASLLSGAAAQAAPHSSPGASAATDGSLSLLGSLPARHVAYQQVLDSPLGDFVYAVDPQAAVIDVYGVQPDGGLAYRATIGAAAPGPVRALALAPSGGFAYAYVKDGGSHFLVTYSVSHSDGLLHYLQTTPITQGGDRNGLSMTPDGRRIYVTSVDRRLDWFSVDKRHGLPAWQGQQRVARNLVGRLAFRPDGTQAYAIDSDNRLEHFAVQAFQGRLDARGTTSVAVPAAAVVISPEGSHLYVASADANASGLLADLDAGGAPGPWRQAGCAASGMAAADMAPDGRLMHAAGADAMLHWYRVAAPPFPAGSYLDGCKSAHYDPSVGTVSALCPTPEGDMVRATTWYRDLCDPGSTMSNEDGGLVCDVLNAGPQGPYNEVCDHVDFAHGVLWTDCSVMGADYPRMLLDYADDCSPDALVYFGRRSAVGLPGLYCMDAAAGAGASTGPGPGARPQSSANSVPAGAAVDATGSLAMPYR